MRYGQGMGASEIGAVTGLNFTFVAIIVGSGTN